MRTKEKIFKYIDQPTFLFFFARFFFFFFFFHASSAKCISGDRALCSLDNRSVSSFSFLLYFIFSLVHLFFLPFFRVSFVFFYFCCFWFTGRTEGNSKDETQTSPNDRERYRVVGSYYTTSVDHAFRPTMTQLLAVLFGIDRSLEQTKNSKLDFLILIFIRCLNRCLLVFKFSSSRSFVRSVTDLCRIEKDEISSRSQSIPNRSYLHTRHRVQSIPKI